MRRLLVSSSAPVRHRPHIAAVVFAIALGGCKRSGREVNDETPRVELRLFEPFPSATLASARPKPAFAALACDGRHVYGVSELGVALAEGVPGIVTAEQPALDTLPDHLSLAAVTVGASSVVAVGARGVIVRREDADSMWKPEASPVTTDLHGIAETPHWIVAVGAGGTVVARRSVKTAQPWTRIASPTQEDLFAVSRCIADHVSTKLCAVGGHGTLLVGDATPGGVVFRLIATGTAHALRAVTPAWWNIAPTHAVGDRGTIVAIDEKGARVVPSGTTEDLLGVAEGETERVNARETGETGILCCDRDGRRRERRSLSSSRSSTTDVVATRPSGT